MTTTATPKTGKSPEKKRAVPKGGDAERGETTSILPASNPRRAKAGVTILKTSHVSRRNPKAGALLKTATRKTHVQSSRRTSFTVFALLDLKEQHPDYLVLSNAIRKGFSVKVIENLKEAGIDKAFRERIVPVRTLQHRIAKGEPLSPAESERAYRFASIVSLADKVFGNHDKGLKWLHKPMKSLDGKSPLDVLDNEPGARIVEDLLGRLDEGYFA